MAAVLYRADLHQIAFPMAIKKNKQLPPAPGGEWPWRPESEQPGHRMVKGSPAAFANDPRRTFGHRDDLTCGCRDLIALGRPASDAGSQIAPRATTQKKLFRQTQQACAFSQFFCKRRRQSELEEHTDAETRLDLQAAADRRLRLRPASSQ
jgi:hypothetical protein